MLTINVSNPALVKELQATNTLLASIAVSLEVIAKELATPPVTGIAVEAGKPVTRE